MPKTVTLALLACLPASMACALTIQLDYSYDSNGFFSATPAAKAAVEKAAADISALLGPSLNAVTTDVYTGTHLDTTATVNWNLTFTNPTTGATVTLNTFSLPTDTFTIYVGMRNLTGTTLGQGGPGGAGFNVGVNGFENEFATALDNAEAASNVAMTRGGGPVMGTLSGNMTLGSTTTSYSLSYGAMVGNLWFDLDTDNNGSADSASLLSSFWHYDPYSAVGADKNDLYSVALHEILHALGIGAGSTTSTWDQLSTGANWAGTAAAALNGGTGVGLLEADSAHIRTGYMSTRLSDGVAQEVVMDPNITTGTRKYLTEMDAAFLKDLGYAVVPEPSTAGLLLAGLVVLARRPRDRRR